VGQTKWKIATEDDYKDENAEDEVEDDKDDDVEKEEEDDDDDDDDAEDDNVKEEDGTFPLGLVYWTRPGNFTQKPIS